MEGSGAAAAALEARAQNLSRKCDVLEESCLELFQRMREMESDARECGHYAELAAMLSSSTSEHIRQVHDSHEKTGLFSGARGQ